MTIYDVLEVHHNRQVKYEVILSQSLPDFDRQQQKVFFRNCCIACSIFDSFNRGAARCNGAVAR